MNIQNIPLNQLFKSAANVRKTGSREGIGELAASIKAHGLLQNLQVTRRTKGEYEVVAGGRRLAALKLLAKRKHIAQNYKTPCHVLDAEDAGEISLAENTVRVPMHPADQFTAFHALAETGKGHEEIAARFGVTASVVKQRLKLASVSPTLIKLYRNEEMTLDQLMAFTVSDDHEAQKLAWVNQPEWRRTPQHIRQTLTAEHVEADDERVRFVGITAYQAAGGEIIRDLFEPEHEGYLTNPALLDRMVSVRLSTEAAKLVAEGWRWVEVVPNLDWEMLRSYGRIEAQEAPLTAIQQKELDRLSTKHDKLIDEHGEDAEPEIMAEIDNLAARIDAIGEERLEWTPQDRAASGVIVTIGAAGTVRVERGLLRTEDKKNSLTVIDGGRSGEEEATDTETASPLSARLVEDLTAERTAALRAMMVDNEAVTLVALAHALALPVFYPKNDEAMSCLDLRLNSRDLRKSAEHIGESGAGILIDVRLSEWLKLLPEHAGALFGWLLTQEKATITRLIAFCAAMSVDGVRGKQDRASCPRLAHADELAASLDLDMTLWWEPTKDRYLARVSKTLILDAVAEGVSKEAAENLSTLKKDALIERASERLKGKGWLPTILRKKAPLELDADPLAIAAE